MRNGRMIKRGLGAAVLMAAGVAAWQAAPAGSAPNSCTATAFVAVIVPDSVIAIDLKSGQASGDPIAFPMSSAPSDTATSPDGKTLYVVLTGSDQLAKVDVATRAITGTVAVGDSPQAIAVSHDGTKLLVTNYNDDDVTVIDGATFAPTGTDIAVGDGPSVIRITPDGTTAFVSNTSGGTMSAINLGTMTKDPADITVGVDPVGMDFTPDGATLYVANRDGDTPTPDPTKSGKLSKIDVASRTVLGDVSGFEMPAGVAITPDGTTGYVTNYGGSYVSSFNLATGVVNAKTHHMSGGPYDIARTPDGLQMYVARVDAATVDIIDIASDAVVGSVTGAGPVLGPSFTPCQVLPPTTTTTVAPTTTIAPTPSVTPVTVSPQFVG